MEITPIRNLSDVESILQHNLFQLNIMSGDISSPADGGHLCRGLPPSAALRWNHYRFVSPLHSDGKKREGSKKSRTLPLLIFFYLLPSIFCLLASDAHAEFTYQNPARTGLEETETRPTGARQFTGSRFQRQEAVSKLEAIALEKELSRLSKELEKTHKENQDFRSKAQQYLETEKLRASGRTQQARAERELGFEYFRHENGMMELYQDGLVGTILNEPVDETDEEGNVVGRGTRDTVDIEYFQGGHYHRMRKHFKVITRSTQEGIQILERDILEYIPGSKWYGTDDPALTNNFQMVQKYKDVIWNSATPYKKDIRLVSGIQHSGDRRPSEWLEVRGSTDSAVLTTTLFKGAGYGPNRGDLNQYQSVSWNTQFPDVLTVAEWQGLYQNGCLIEETTHQVDLADGTTNVPTSMIEQMFQEVEQSLQKARSELRENPFQPMAPFIPAMAEKQKPQETQKIETKGIETKDSEKTREQVGKVGAEPQHTSETKQILTPEEVSRLFTLGKHEGLFIGAVSSQLNENK